MTEKMNSGTTLLHRLKLEKLTEFGSEFNASFVREVLGIKTPLLGTKRQFDEIAIAELAAIDHVRATLLNEGKYLGMRDGNYRVLLPSENAKQVDAYMESANKKLHRALKLARNTPKDVAEMPSTVETRILMKRDSIKQKQQHMATMA